MRRLFIGLLLLAGAFIPAQAAFADNSLAMSTQTVTPVVQTISSTNLAKGTHTFNFNASTQPWTFAQVTIDRTITNGLNSLVLGVDTLQLDVQYSTDGGTTWNGLCGATFQGGTIVTKGVTLNTEFLSCSTANPFTTNTSFRVITTASTRVFIAGSVTYTD